MKRKIIKQGHNTLTITLPKKWVDKTNIKPGDEVDLMEQDDQLIIASTFKPKTESISVDISQLDRTSTLILLQGLYRYGYDSIIVNSEKPAIPHYRVEKNLVVSEVIHSINQRFIGAEIVSSKATSFHIKKISQESYEEFEVVLRRIFRLVNEMSEVFIQALEHSDKRLLESIEFHHVNVKKFINYCLRLLNKFGYADKKKTVFYFTIIQYISKSEDLLKNAARSIIKNNFKMSAPAIKEIKNINEVLVDYYELFYSFNRDKVSEIIAKREQQRNWFYTNISKFSKQEIVIISSLKQINELVVDMIELRMALEH